MCIDGVVVEDVAIQYSIDSVTFDSVLMQTWVYFVSIFSACVIDAWVMCIAW